MQGITFRIGCLLSVFSTSHLFSWPKVTLETLNQKNLSELHALHKISHIESNVENRRWQLQNYIYYSMYDQ